MAWVALIVCGLVLWAGCAGVLAMGREIWPGEMPEAVRLALAPAIACAATLPHKIIAPDFNPLVRAAAFTAIVAALDALVFAPAPDRGNPALRKALGIWLPLAAIFLASLVSGAFGPT